MKWIRLTKPAAEVQAYNLVQSKIIKETLRYHPQQQSARLNCNGQQRLFFIEPQGLRNTQFVIKNEYGFYEAKIGVGYTSPKEESGVIEYEQQKIQFTFFHDKLVSELVIYKQDGLKPIAVCDLQMSMDEKEIPLFVNKSVQGLYASLTWSLYWWLITDADRTATESFAKTVIVAANSPVLVN